MDEFEFLGKIHDIPVDSRKVFRIGHRDVAVFRVNHQFYALKNSCPHHGEDLGSGTVENGRVRCPGHGYQFDLQSGQCDRDPGLCASTYDLRIWGDDIFIRF